MAIDLKSYFKSHGNIQILRSSQVKALDEISRAFQSGIKKINLRVPAGEGKSEIARILMNFMEDTGKTATVCSPQNNQVQQYENEGLITLKGRSNYLCHYGGTCETGRCQLEICPKNDSIRDCKERPYNYCKMCLCGACNFKKAKKIYLEASKRNTNMSMAILGFAQSDMVIIDESGKIESILREHYQRKIQGIREHTTEQQINNEKLNVIKNPDLKYRLNRLKQLESILESMEFLRNNKDSKNWSYFLNEETNYTEYYPINSIQYLNQIIQNEYIICMSATPPKIPGFTQIDVETSIPIQARQWQYIPIGSMVAKQRVQTIPKLAKWLIKLKGKTVVHARSYKTGELIAEELRKLNVWRYLQEQKKKSNQLEFGEEKYDRYNIVEAMIKCTDSDKITILTNQTEGLNLYHDDIINSVSFCPWLNKTDELVKAKNDYYGSTSWQNEVMRDEIIQTIARIFRNEKPGIYKGLPVFKKSFIVDTSFGQWYQSNKAIFPKSFREAQKLI